MYLKKQKQKLYTEQHTYNIEQKNPIKLFKFAILLHTNFNPEIISFHFVWSSSSSLSFFLFKFGFNLFIKSEKKNTQKS